MYVFVEGLTLNTVQKLVYEAQLIFIKENYVEKNKPSYFSANSTKLKT